MNAQLQDWLSKLRTDLDNFGDVEAGALMLDGYRMINEELQGREEFADPASSPLPHNQRRWHFGALDRHLKGDRCEPEVERRLTVGTGRFVKPLRFYKAVGLTARFVLSSLIGFVVGFAVVYLVAFFIDPTMRSTVIEYSLPAWVPVGFLAFLLVGISYITQRPKQPANFIVSRALPVLVAPVLWVVAGVQLRFNFLYLKLASYKSIGIPKPGSYPLERLPNFSTRTRPNVRL
jgi:hypothetical protein